jgi:hypothetical protein
LFIISDCTAAYTTTTREHWQRQLRSARLNRQKSEVKKVAMVNWEPAEFHHWYEQLPVRKREQAWADLERNHQKTYIEWKTFRGFAEASDLDIDPRSIEMCDPNSATSPLSDVRCSVSGELEYFKLGEVTDEDLARTASIAMKNPQSVYGGVVSQCQPLVRIFLKKYLSRYTTNGRPLRLVLHFAMGLQSPVESLLNADLEKWRPRIVQRIPRSPYSTVWLFDYWQKRVLVLLNRWSSLATECHLGAIRCAGAGCCNGCRFESALCVSGHHICFAICPFGDSSDGVEFGVVQHADRARLIAAGLAVTAFGAFGLFVLRELAWWGVGELGRW